MKLWIDIDNAPHVLVMKPIIDWLSEQGHEVEVTARDYGQTVPLLEIFGIPFTLIGKHAGRKKYRKILFFLSRSLSLFVFARRRRFAAIFCHGTRGVYIPARLLGLPLVVMTDYEHGALPNFMRSWPRLLLVPEVIPDEGFRHRGCRHCEIRKYHGLKEELYVYDLEPDPRPLLSMGIDLEKPLVLIRPPASMAHYHVKEGQTLFLKVLDFFHRKINVQVLLIPRTREQATEMRDYLTTHDSPNIQIPIQVGYGPNMIYYSDLVISGGGTMNREAACIGVPVLTIFRGPLGSVDRQLIHEGKLRMLEKASDLEKVDIVKITKPSLVHKQVVRKDLVSFIGNTILSVGSEKSTSSFGSGKQKPTGF